MDHQDELTLLRAKVADYEIKSRKTKWLLRQLGKKVRNFPQDLKNKARRAADRRRSNAVVAQVMAEQVSIAHEVNQAAPEETNAPRAVEPAPIAFKGRFFHVHAEREAELLSALKADPRAARTLAGMETFAMSAQMRDLVAAAAAIAPEIGSLDGLDTGYLSPWHDGYHVTYRRALERIPEGPFDHVVLVPFGKLGGADFVAGVVAEALSRKGKTLILLTDLPDWDRPDWYPAEVPSIDISAELSALPDRPRALYLILRQIGARSIVNVNSRLAFDMMVDYGARLALTSQLHAYFFCADRDEHGNEAGYPVWYFAPLLPFLTTAICDSADLAGTLTRRFALPEDLRAKVRTVYTPARTALPETPVVARQIDSRAQRARPRILWAGRLDRQKRFDILVALARSMPDVQFDCWGKAVLDAPPDLSRLPSNVRMHGAFKDFDDLPLGDCDGWLYTSEWDGLPTTLIELGALGMPIVASAVGGVPELIDETTGWPVRAEAGLDGYRAALRAMLDNPEDRRSRALALQARVADRHGLDTYSKALAGV